VTQSHFNPDGFAEQAARRLRMGARRSWCVASFCLGVLLFFSSQTHAAAPSTTPVAKPVPDEVRFIVGQVQKSREKFKDLSYQYKLFNYSGPDWKLEETTEGTVKRLGDLVQCDKTSTPESKDGPFPGPRRSTGFVGQTSSARYHHMPRAMAEEYEYATPREISEKAKNAMAPFEPFVPDICAFGTGSEWLKDLLEQSLADPEMGYWRLKYIGEPDPRTLIQIEIYFKALSLPSVPSYVLRIDPVKGFGVTHFESHDNVAPYALLHFTDIVLTDISGRGSWYPTKVVTQYYEKEPALKFAWEAVVSNILVSPPSAPGDFTVARLDLPEGARLLRWGASGDRTLLVQEKDRLVLASQDSIGSSPPATPSKSVQTSAIGNGGTRWNVYFILAVLVFVLGLALYWFARIVENRRRS
jgi:hypothetical protein